MVQDSRSPETTLHFNALLEFKMITNKESKTTKVIDRIESFSITYLAEPNQDPVLG